MKEKIEIRNILRSINPKSDFKGIRIGFCFAGEKALANNNNYKGFTENACYYDNPNLFDKLPIELIGKVVDVTLKTIQSTRNPMKSVSVIDTIFYNGSSIRLL